MKLLGVEAARGVAALLVVTLHAAHILGGPQDYGRQAFGGLMAAGRQAASAKPRLVRTEPRLG